jgi:hypothetical protein
MVTATADDEPQATPKDVLIRALAGALMRGLEIPAQQALGVAAALVEQGVKVDVAEQVDLTWAKQATEAILAENPPRLSEAEINHAAHVERVKRLTETAKHSAGQLIPSPADHAQIDRLLDEMAGVA